MGAKEAVGGVIALVVVCALGYLRYEARQARYERNEAAYQARCVDFKAHAHKLMDQAREAKQLGPLLHAGVDQFHDQAWDAESDSGLLYRNELFRLINEDATKKGREDI